MSDDNDEPMSKAKKKGNGATGLQASSGSSDAIDIGSRYDGRIQKGERRNPRGRPKGRKNNKTLVREAFLTPAIEVQLNGKKRKASKKELAYHQVGNQAARGDLKAFDRMNELLDRYDDVDEAEPTDEEHAANLSVGEHIYLLHKKYKFGKAGHE
ncbi:MAG: DUF5681 domain-containing protein [Pseudomonadota bacterium]